jgi:hypothetical protein
VFVNIVVDVMASTPSFDDFDDLCIEELHSLDLDDRQVPADDQLAIAAHAA